MASKGKGGGGGLLCRETSSRSASFHGRSTAAAAEMRRPKTHPELLGCTAGRSAASVSRTWRRSSTDDDDQRRRRVRVRVRVPAKVLVNVTVQRSLLGPLQLMASTDWTVEKLIDEALKQYRKEGRRPLLTTTLLLDPSSAFALHYSHFSLQSLDPKEKLIELGSRNFFLCPNHHHQTPPPPPPPPPPAAAPPTSSSSSSSSCSGEADKTSKITIPWLRFMNFLL